MKPTKHEIAITHLTTLTIVVLFFIPPPSSAFSLSDSLFPRIEVTLSNESGDDLYYLCDFKGYNKWFQSLPSGEKITWEFRRHLFPTRWCYIYVDDQHHGFFRVYTVRLRCDKCFWKITNGPYIRREPNKFWELFYLRPLPGTTFNPDQPG